MKLGGGRGSGAWIAVPFVVALLTTPSPGVPRPGADAGSTPFAVGENGTAVGNFSAAIGRLVTLVGAAGGGLLALVWTRVALSWFSNDLSKKVQAKDRARDALIGTLLFVAALSGLLWALARWVVGGG
ncbi:MAG: hypothetical protein L3K15_04090 [Thermoplasmata archaeon]|nr:hypothetical protein [Thermoplasmata archaeon]